MNAKRNRNREKEGLPNRVAQERGSYRAVSGRAAMRLVAVRIACGAGTTSGVVKRTRD